jgi:hypothetical protein
MTKHSTTTIESVLTAAGRWFRVFFFPSEAICSVKERKGEDEVKLEWRGRFDDILLKVCVKKFWRREHRWKYVTKYCIMLPEKLPQGFGSK